MKEDSELPAKQILQSHSGTGDNVGVKHVHHSIAPSAIQKPIEEILTKIRHRDVDNARDKLAILQRASQLDATTVALLSAVSVLVDLANGNPPEDSYSIVESCPRPSGDGFISDIILSTLIRLDVYNKKSESASRRFNAIDLPGEYCQESFLELLADYDFLEGHFSKNEFALSEITLCGLVRGLLRCENCERSVYIADQLKSKYPYFNSKVISLIARCHQLNSLISSTPYWLITRSAQKRALELVDETIELMDDSAGTDKRLVNQAILFLSYFVGCHKGLIDACWKYATKIEELDSHAASYLRSIKERDTTSQVVVHDEIDRAERDFSYRKSLIKRLIERAEISQEELFILRHVAKSNDINQWINNGGKVLTENDLEHKFTDIELHCHTCNGSRKSKEEIKRLVQGFLECYERKLPQINPFRLLGLSNKLSDLGLYPQVCALLKPVIREKELWISPVARCYIVALVNSQQFTTLKSIIDEIPQEDWCSFLWEVMAKKLEYINDLLGAIRASEKALVLEPGSIHLWRYLVYLHKKNGTSYEVYIDLLERIPDELFNHPSEQAWSLLFEMYCNGGFSRVEDIVVSWFVNNPDGCAIGITNFYLAKAVNVRKDLVLQPSPTTDLCLGGYTFLDDGGRVSKLIVRNVDANHSALLSSDSPVGKLLLSMKVGETTNHGMREIQLVEVLPPYVAVLRLAADLRQASNDGSDCYYQFSVPDDPEEMVKSVEKKLQASTDQTKERICSNPEIPLFIKGHRFDRDCPVEAAISQYCSPSSIKHPLPNLGESQPRQVLLDVYAIVYLGLTGLTHGLIERDISIAITIETKALLDVFLENIGRADYMKVGVDKLSGKLHVITAEQVQNETADVQFAIKHVLGTADIVAPCLVDMPPEIVSIRDSLDASVYSSLALSISNDLPWLCVDPIFAKLSTHAKYPIANALHFFMSLSASVDFEKKSMGLYRHVSCGLPCPLTFEDLLQLSKSEDKNADYFLFRLLKMYPNAYPDTEAAIFHLNKILLMVLIKAFMDGEVLRGLIAENPRNRSYTEHVFNICCRLSMGHADGREAEYKLAMLLCAVMERLRGVPSMLDLVNRLATAFALGHFMSIDAINSHIRNFFQYK